MSSSRSLHDCLYFALISFFMWHETTAVYQVVKLALLLYIVKDSWQISHDALVVKPWKVGCVKTILQVLTFACFLAFSIFVTEFIREQITLVWLKAEKEILHYLFLFKIEQKYSKAHNLYVQHIEREENYKVRGRNTHVRYTMNIEILSVLG